MTKRYPLLDGLRGVAALMVILYHLFECFPADTWIVGHGYLAVDFFFILSGFVIGYAYDRRWKDGSLNTWGFFKKRLIRLHPMVVFGIILGVITFFIQGGVQWDGSKVAISAVMLAVLLHLFMIPAVPGGVREIRGNGEMFPLNGPHWSLFFEYIGNIAYALLIRRLPTKALRWLTALVGIGLAVFVMSDAAGYGNMGVGWTLDGPNFWGGLLRMLFPYSLGLLMSRDFVSGKLKPLRIKGAFWVCSLLLVGFMAVPGIGIVRWNCAYELFCVMAVFPLVLWLGASGSSASDQGTSLCKFLGDISYPLYAVHYPSMYLFYNYIGFPETWRTPAQTWPWMLALLAGNILLAWLVFRLYDAPVRRWLSRQ